MTNLPAGADTVQPAQEPLGTLLVKRGLITDEQLAAALADQKASGEPLGKIVVKLGFATPASVAQALATQHGGLLKTEYGFATGFGSALKPPALAVGVPPVSTERRGARGPAEASVAAAAPPPDTTLRSELAHASAESERLREDNERLAKLRAELEQRLATESQRAASLERELAAAGEASAAPSSELEEALANEVRRAATLEAEVAARDAAIEEFKETGEGWKRALAERDEAIADLLAARDEALAKVRDADAADEARADVEAHRAAVDELTAARDDALAQLRTTKALLDAADEARADAEAYRATIDELTAARDEALAQLRTTKAHLAELDAKLPELERSIKSGADALAERDVALAELTAAHEALLADRAQEAAGPWAAAERHLLFFCGAEGWELVERAGPPPAAGDAVEVPGGTRHVARVGASPAPGPKLPCAYLLG